MKVYCDNCKYDLKIYSIDRTVHASFKCVYREYEYNEYAPLKTLSILIFFSMNINGKCPHYKEMIKEPEKTGLISRIKRWMGFIK
jgi:hypothetical protein